MVAPHLIAGRIWEEKRDVFFQRFLGLSTNTVAAAEAKLRNWWAAVPSLDPRLEPMITQFIAAKVVRSKAEFFRRAIPFALHGDAVPCTTRMSLDCISWYPCIPSSLPTIDKKWLISAVLNRCVAPRTLQVLWTVILWSLTAFVHGVHPDVDYQGRDFLSGSDASVNAGAQVCGGFFFCLWMVKGDLEYFANYLHLNHFASMFPCPWCDCNSLAFT